MDEVWFIFQGLGESAIWRKDFLILVVYGEGVSSGDRVGKEEEWVKEKNQKKGKERERGG